MLQELFRIPFLDLPVYGYGLMLVLGVFAAVELGRFLANRHGLDGDAFFTFGLIALFSGVVGARLSHILENLGQYTDPEQGVVGNVKNMLNLSNGGLTFYGGFLLAAPTLLIYSKRKGLPLRLWADLVAPTLMVGLAFGRVGCLLNGCCWGQVCDPREVPWAVTFPYASPPHTEQFRAGVLEVPAPLTKTITTQDGRRATVLLPRSEVAKKPALQEMARRSRSLTIHPTQIYSTLNALLIAAVCLAYITLRRSAGQVFALMLILYSVGRFTLETIRIEPPVPLLGIGGTESLGLSYSMWTALFTFAAGVLLWLTFQAEYRPAGPVVDADAARGLPAATA